VSQPTIPGLPFADLERIYDELAEAIDATGPQRESVFLATLVLRLAQELGDGARVSALIGECLAEPDPATASKRLV
jgi:hypothetical protein